MPSEANSIGNNTRNTVMKSRCKSVSGVQLWNALPEELKDSTNVSKCKKGYKVMTIDMYRHWVLVEKGDNGDAVHHYSLYGHLYLGYFPSYGKKCWVEIKNYIHLKFCTKVYEDSNRVKNRKQRQLESHKRVKRSMCQYTPLSNNGQNNKTKHWNNRFNTKKERQTQTDTDRDTERADWLFQGPVKPSHWPVLSTEGSRAGAECLRPRYNSRCAQRWANTRAMTPVSGQLPAGSSWLGPPSLAGATVTSQHIGNGLTTGWRVV